MSRDSVLSLVGLAKKAGRIASGEFQTENAVKSGKASLVIISAEASENTKKKFRDLCTYRKVTAYCYGSREALGLAVGCGYRASAAVLDGGFAKALQDRLTQAKAERLTEAASERQPEGK